MSKNRELKALTITVDRISNSISSTQSDGNVIHLRLEIFSTGHRQYTRSGCENQVSRVRFHVSSGQFKSSEFQLSQGTWLINIEGDTVHMTLDGGNLIRIDVETSRSTTLGQRTTSKNTGGVGSWNDSMPVSSQVLFLVLRIDLYIPVAFAVVTAIVVVRTVVVWVRNDCSWAAKERFRSVNVSSIIDRLTVHNIPRSARMMKERNKALNNNKNRPRRRVKMIMTTRTNVARMVCRFR